MRLFTTPEGKIIISIIWGLGIATLFRKVCKDNCIIINSVDPYQVSQNIYKVTDDSGTRCVKYTPRFIKCNINKN